MEEEGRKQKKDRRVDNCHSTTFNIKMVGSEKAEDKKMEEEKSEVVDTKTEDNIERDGQSKR